MEVLPCPVSVDFYSRGGGFLDITVNCEDDAFHGACQALEKRLEDELRAAKSDKLACGEVLLPPGLLSTITKEILKMAENEPCGLRGCTLFIHFESEQTCRKISTIKCDPSTVSTFELWLNLKQDSVSWHSLIPQFLKNLRGGGKIMMSQSFTLHKKKLYRSYLE